MFAECDAALIDRNISTDGLTAAARLARWRWSNNLAALGCMQPDVAARLGDFPVEMQWVFARDGALTALDSDGQWWAGCSVPQRAAEKLLKSLDISPLVSAYLSPAHAELLVAARQRMGPEPALLAIIPSPGSARMILSTGDFADDIGSHRLWFIVSDDWADGLRQLLIDQPGLPPPGRFIRSRLTESEATDVMIGSAQQVLGEVASARSSELERRLAGTIMPAAEIKRVLVIAPSRFRMWDDAPLELLHHARKTNLDILRFDSADPASSSPLALALTAAECDAVLAADVYRADAANVVHTDKPWITWATRGGVRGFASAGPADRIITADADLREMALAAGWPVDRLTDGARASKIRPEPAQPNHLAILLDLPVVLIPPHIEDLSSHRLLWEHIDSEIDTNPLVIGDDPMRYLMDRASQLEISRDELDVHAFVDGLIIPRWQRSVARQLASAGIPIVLHGHGWSDDPSLAHYALGPVIDSAAFETALNNATAVLNVWPGSPAAFLNKANRAVVSGTSSLTTLLNSIRRVMSRKTPVSTGASLDEPKKSLSFILADLLNGNERTPKRVH